MRAVLDTNVLLSGLLWHGAPHSLMEQARAGALQLITSPALLAELARVAARPKFRTAFARSDIDLEQMLANVRLLAELAVPEKLPARVSRDPDDDAVLALAVAARADVIVSGDEDLLALVSYSDIPIVSPAKAIVMLGS